MNEELKLAYDEYRSKGFILNKSAKYKKYSSRKGTLIERDNEPWQDDATGYVAIIPPSIIIVDNDKYEESNEFDKLLKDLNLGYTPEPFAYTPSGGEHYAFINPYPDMVIGKHGYKAVDIYSGYQSVIPIVGTKVLNKQNKYNTYTWADELEDAIILNPFKSEMLDIFQMRERAVMGNGYSDVDYLTHVSARPPKEEMEEWLYKINPSSDYNTWANVLRALNSWDLGGEEGLEMAIKWSQTAEEHDSADEITKKYNANQANTPEFYKKLVGIVNSNSKSSFNKKIKEATTEEDLFEIAKEISASDISNNDRTDYIDKLCEKNKELGNKLEKVKFKKAVAKEPSEVTLKNGQGTWLSSIAYVQSMKHPYVQVESGMCYNNIAISGLYASELKELKTQLSLKSNPTIENLVKWGRVTICGGHEYNPTMVDKIFTKKGAKFYNLFDVDSRPPIAEEYTEEGLRHINLLVEHLKNIMDNDEAELLLQWLAYTVQNFGKKILWSPIIQGVDGIGKTLVATAVINHCLGTHNAGATDGNTVSQEQTSWVANSVFKVIEEIKIDGHNRYEIVNRLKPFITNPTVMRVEKYETSTEVRNYCNIMALTNHTDAIPFYENDRRWWAVLCKHGTLASLEKAVGMNRKDYFQPLQDIAKEGSVYGGEFHKFMLEYDISNFEPNFAPYSKHKAMLTATEDDKTPFLTDVKELIESSCRGVTREVVGTAQLKDALRLQGHDRIGNNELTVVLRKLGFVKLEGRVKANGEAHNVWTSLRHGDSKEIRELFRDSLTLPEVEISGFDNLDEDEF